MPTNTLQIWDATDAPMEFDPFVQRARLEHAGWVVKWVSHVPNRGASPSWLLAMLTSACIANMSMQVRRFDHGDGEVRIGMQERIA